MSPLLLVAVAVLAAALVGAGFFILRRQPGTTAAPTKSKMDDEASARRLARAIASDIALYNDEDCKLARKTGTPPAKLVAALAEGRELFQSRVSPSLHGLYDGAIDDVVFAAPLH